MLGVGLDVVDNSRIRAFADEHTERLVELLTSRELAHCRGRRRWRESVAGRIAAKEAVIKALEEASGFFLDWREIEILPVEGARPVVRLHGEADQIARRRGIRRILVSISHSAQVSIAGAVALGGGGR